MLRVTVICPQAIREIVNLPRNTPTQSLEALSNACKDVEEAQLIAEIQQYLARDLDQARIWQAIQEQVESLAKSGAGPRVSLVWRNFVDREPPF